MKYLEYLTVDDLWEIRDLAQAILKEFPFMEKIEAVKKAEKIIRSK